MNKYFAFLLVVVAFWGCNKETDLSGIEQELAELRDKNKHLQDEIDEMKKPVPAAPVLLHRFHPEGTPVSEPSLRVEVHHTS